MFNLNGNVGIVTGASSGLGTGDCQCPGRGWGQGLCGQPDGWTQGSVGGLPCVHCACEGRYLRHGADGAAGPGDRGQPGAGFPGEQRGDHGQVPGGRVSDGDFKKIHKVNVESVFFLSKLCYPYLKQSKHAGRIVNITSMAAHLGFSEVVPYCSSKGAVLAMTRGLAVEWAQDNVTVNSIARDGSRRR